MSELWKRIRVAARHAQIDTENIVRKLGMSLEERLSYSKWNDSNGDTGKWKIIETSSNRIYMIWWS